MNTRDLTAILFDVYRAASENTCEFFDADGRTRAQMFLRDTRWGGQRLADVEQFRKQILKLTGNEPVRKTKKKGNAK